MAHVFISYAHKDGDYARRLVTEIETQGITVWFDDKIPTGAFWVNDIIENLSASAALVVIMTSAATESEWVQKELLHAMTRNLPILPLLLSGEVFPLLIDRQFERVNDSAMPSKRFFDLLTTLVQPKTSVISSENRVSIFTGDSPSTKVYLEVLESYFEATLAHLPDEFTAQQFILELAQRHQSDYIRALGVYQDREAPFRDLHGQISKRLKARDDLVSAHGQASSRNIWGDSGKSELYRKTTNG